ncbi:Lysosomal alpha-glucosidase [Penaeus vannamei]|uniref:Lysosomal alpha-glucosidase n=1 Tax=Penaeus vannamei TaxID=6689 RepID=A0A3R7MNV6_PENVA|nr:Lysosomal alpha-glucosidase [Penaeus vannamei]
MVQCQTRKTKKSSEVLFDDDLSPGINVTRDNVKITKTAITVVAGWMLFACMLTILIWGLPNFECGLSFSPFTISIKKLKYIDPHSEGDLLKAKEYQNWVRNWQYGNNISFRKDCGEECLDGNASKEENPQLPLEEPKKVEGSFCVDIPLEMRFDCHPDGSPSESSCVKRGCCWHELQEIPERKVPFPAPRLHRPTHGKALEDLPLNIPYCFYPRDYVGYSVTNFTSAEHGYTGFLERSVASVFPKDSPLLQMDVYFETDTRLRVRITDPFQLRWETPVPIVPQVNKSASNPSYSFHIRNEDGAFTVVRKSSGVPIFDTRGAAPLTFADQFIQLSSMLPSNYIYGLGEHLEGLLLDTYWKRHVLWNLDQIPEPGKNMYGSHPFYLSLEPDGNTHGVFLLNSNAMGEIFSFVL